MAEWQDHPSRGTGSARGPTPAGPPPLVPSLDDDGHVALEPGEAWIGTVAADDVRFRSRCGNADQRWGPLDTIVTLTTHRVVLVATPGTPDDARWSIPGPAPVMLRAIEPRQASRGIAPVRIAGHLRWSCATRVEATGDLVTIAVPASLGAEALLKMRVPGQLAHRFVAIGRTAFLTGKRLLTFDTPDRVDAPLR